MKLSHKVIGLSLVTATILASWGIITQGFAEEKAPAATPPAATTSAADTTVTTKTSTALPITDVQRFTTAIGEIKNYYVKSVDDGKLFEDAIRGMLEGLDPHSSYLDVDEYTELKNDTVGEFAGLGIEVGMEDGYLRVVSPLDDTPAQHAGLKPEDLIVKIDGKNVKGMTLQAAVKLMRGPKGSIVNLMVIRKGEGRILKFSVARDVIKIDSVKSRLLDPGYGYIRISHFQMGTGENVAKAIAQLQQQSGGSLKGVVIDLRNNPGGLLDAAIDVSNNFLDSKNLGYKHLIVYTKGRIPSANVELKATEDDRLHGVPMVVLINEGSASASEIVAGALQDHRRAVIMGMTSFGKGSVQTVLPLDDERGLKLTTALYYTPAGRSIQAEGIVPDVEVKDLQIKTSKSQNSWVIALLKEADLDNHLANGNALHVLPKNQGNTDAQKQPTAVPTQPAATEDNGNTSVEDEKSTSDYQLSEALNLLKALSVVQKKPS